MVGKDANQIGELLHSRKRRQRQLPLRRIDLPGFQDL